MEIRIEQSKNSIWFTICYDDYDLHEKQEKERYDPKTYELKKEDMIYRINMMNERIKTKNDIFNTSHRYGIFLGDYRGREKRNYHLYEKPISSGNHNELYGNIMHNCQNLRYYSISFWDAILQILNTYEMIGCKRYIENVKKKIYNTNREFYKIKKLRHE